MTPLADDVARFSEFLTHRVGLTGFDASVQLDQLLAERMRATASATADAYFRLLLAAETADQEMCQLAEQLTVGETYFFRYPEQFRVLAEVALPDLAGRVGASRPLRMLSAGCASGEEAYTLAMVAREAGLERQGLGVRIEGVDINGLYLAKARRGHYSDWSLRGVLPAIRDRYFKEQRGGIGLNAGLREMVTFSQANLMQLDRATDPAAYDVIFCRNVLIYFSADATRHVLRHLERALAPGGYLFLGHAESARLAAGSLVLEQSHNTFFYRKAEARPERAPVPARAPAAPTRDRSAALSPSRVPTQPLPAAAAPDLGQARSLFVAERFAEAEAVLRELVELEAQQLEALLMRGLALLNIGRAKDAEGVCRRALALDEFSAGAQYLLALYYEQAGETRMALKSYEAASYLDAGFALPHLRIGLLAKRAGDQGRARRALSHALGLLPAEDDDRLVLFCGGFGRAALEQLCRSELA